jgi:hypothetical protein
MGFVGEDGRFYADPEVPSKEAVVKDEPTKKDTDVVDKEQHPFAGELTRAEGLKANASKASDKK